MEELVEQRQQELAMLDDVADMNIPKTINTYENTEEDHRAQQVISPDGTSTFDGTSTIGSATSEPTTETASRTSRASNSKASQSKASVRKSSTAKSSRSKTRKPASPGPNGTKGSARSSSGRNYRSSHYGGSSRVQQSVPRPFKRAGPLSYSKTVRLTGAGSPYSGREVDDKTRAVLADMNEFDANQAETE